MSTILRAKDAIVARASSLPANLVLDEKALYFSIVFLLKLNDEELEILRKEASKKKNDIKIEFFYKFKDSIKPPHSISKFEKFDWQNVTDIKISGDTVPQGKSFHDGYEDYLSVVFTLS